MPFLSTLRVKSDGKDGWILLTPLIYVDDETRETYVVPPDFQTDLASIPHLFQPLFPVNDSHRSASVLHDYLYEVKVVPRDEADRIFYNAMLNSGVSPLKARLIYSFVRIFGQSAWDDKLPPPPADLYP